MAIPVLHLNLAPPPSLWRRRHPLIGWLLLSLGLVSFLTSVALTWWAYLQADRLGRQAEGLSRQALSARTRLADLQRDLMAIDVMAEAPRWRLAERILSARSAPWSRVTAELEACMVPDMRIRTLQRTRTPAGDVVLKLKGEGRSRAAQSAFIEALAAHPYFEPMSLEREGERQGGGVEFEGTVRLRPDPPAYAVPRADGIAPQPTPQVPSKPMPPTTGATPAAPLKPSIAPPNASKSPASGEASTTARSPKAPSPIKPAIANVEDAHEAAPTPVRSRPQPETPEGAYRPKIERPTPFRRSRPEARP